MSYPVAYRKAAQAHPGFQRRAPAPANDNPRLRPVRKSPLPHMPSLKPENGPTLRPPPRFAKPSRGPLGAIKIAARLARGLPLSPLQLAIAIAEQLPLPLPPEPGDIAPRWEAPFYWYLNTYGNGSKVDIGPSLTGYPNGEAPAQYRPLGGQAVSTDGPSEFTNIIGYWERNPPPLIQTRYFHVATWRRTFTGSLSPAKIGNLPYRFPRLNPAAPAPLLDPLPHLPYRQIPLKPSNAPGRQAGHAPSPAPNPMTRPVATSPVPWAHRHTRSPPPPGVKERKFKLALTPGGVQRAIGAAGELLDGLDALHESLPQKYRAKPAKGHRVPTPQEKMRALYRNWKHVEPTEALKNFLANHYEDKAWGILGRINAKAARKAGNSTGFQIGPGAPYI